MKQAIAGVAPTSIREVTNMMVWPSNGAYAFGRGLGRLFAMDAGFYVFRLGNLIALLLAPLAMLIYFWRVLPFVGSRYRVTNRRIVVERGWSYRPDKFIDLDKFDSIEVVVRSGQEWYCSGDLIFRQGETETFRLEGVSRPESFRQVCMKARNAFVGVQDALKSQGVSVERLW